MSTKRIGTVHTIQTGTIWAMLEKEERQRKISKVKQEIMTDVTAYVNARINMVVDRLLEELQSM